MEPYGEADVVSASLPRSASLQPAIVPLMLVLASSVVVMALAANRGAPTLSGLSAAVSLIAVVAVQLDEGPGMFGRFACNQLPRIGMRIQTVIERWDDGLHFPVFVGSQLGDD